MASSISHRKTRDEYKKEKELDEARKAGNAPAELDEEGKEINPHIPEYILKAPWYLNANKPSLKHQRGVTKKEMDKGWYLRGATTGEAATKFRKGACENCGAMTHKTKDCCERPRKLGAKFTNDDIKPDEVIQKLELDYDSKRDPYNGYDPSSYKEVMDIYEKADTERKKKKLQELIKQHGGGDKKTPDVDETLSKELMDNEEKEGSYDSETVAPIQKLDQKSRTTIRNLRIREDTAKYLYNLDVNSAFYEPKSRSMRDNPLPNANPNDIKFAGDNFARTSGETKEFRDLQRFAWEAQEKGQDVDISSAPSQAALLHADFLRKKEQLKQQTRNQLLTKYGGEEHLLKQEEIDKVPQSEIYTEYSSSGKLIKGEEKIVKSKYEEDVFLNNHKSIWGSYWENGQWGFACCRQLIKNAYCTGEKGKLLREKQLQQQQHHHIQQENQQDDDDNDNTTTTTTTTTTTSLLEQHLNKSNEDNDKYNKKEGKRKDKKERKEKEEKLKKALKDQDEENKKSVEKDERNIKYNSLSADDYNVSEEQMEAYNLKRKRSDDPMANFKDDSD
ncbi:hypothetical protein ACTFIW_001094 [Dictyostelium discoideum]